MYTFSINCSFFLLWKEFDRTRIIASYYAIGGAPFVQQSILKPWGGEGRGEEAPLVYLLAF